MNSERLKKQKLFIPQLRGTIANKYKNRFAFGMLGVGTIFGVICGCYCYFLFPSKVEVDVKKYMMGLPVPPPGNYDNER